MKKLLLNLLFLVVALSLFGCVTYNEPIGSSSERESESESLSAPESENSSE